MSDSRYEPLRAWVDSLDDEELLLRLRQAQENVEFTERVSYASAEYETEAEYATELAFETAWRDVLQAEYDHRTGRK